MRQVVSSIEREYERCKALTERALNQLSESELTQAASGSGQYLSIPPGQSGEYNKDPAHEKPPSSFTAR
jgi:hypothetical protein